MTTQSQPRSDDADRNKESTPAGVAEDLEELAEDTGAEVGPSDEDAEAAVDAGGRPLGPDEVEGPNSN